MCADEEEEKRSMEGINEEEEIRIALNREGYAFQQAVRKRLQSLKWHTSTEYPYSLDGYLKGRMPTLKDPYIIDILGSKRVENIVSPGWKGIRLIVECKKGYQQRKKWVFLKTEEHQPFAWCIENKGSINNVIEVETTKTLDFKPETLVIADNSVSLKKKSGALKSEGPNSSIYKASNQVAHALFGIKKGVDFEMECNTSNITEEIFLPIVMTNLPLYVAELYNKNYKLSTPNWVIYYFTPPTYLHTYADWGPQDPFDKPIMKLPIIFLNFGYIETFLEKIVSSFF